MPRSFLLLLILSLMPGIANGQSTEEDDPLIPADYVAPPFWELHLGGTAIRVSELNGYGFGSTLLVNCNFGHEFGAELGTTAIFWSDGFYRFGGISADLGAVYSWWSYHSNTQISIGPSMLAGSDSDGTFLAFGGGYVGAEFVYWPAGQGGGNSWGWFGLFARGSIHLWNSGDFSPAGTVGIAIKL